MATALIDSPAGIRQYFQRVFAAEPPPQVMLGDGLVRDLGDVAIHSGCYDLTVGLPSGDMLRLAARFSFTYRQARDSVPWLILDHHSSALPAPAQPA